MPIAKGIKESMSKSSWIRRMFEEGIKMKAEFGAEKVFDFSLGNPDLEPPPEFHETLIRLIKEPVPRMHGYMPNSGYPWVREAVARRVAEEQETKIGGDHIVMTVGAAGALNVVFKAIINPGDEVIVPKPYFTEYGTYVANSGGILKPVSSKPGFSLDADAIRAALTERTAAVLINSPNNPSGRIYPKEDLASLAKVLSTHGKQCGRMPYLIADEPYRSIAYDGVKVPPVLPVYPETIVVSSWSKSLSLAGERIGYIAANPSCEAVSDIMGALTMCTRTLGFVNAPALMQRAIGELPEARADMSRYEIRRNMIAEGMRKAGFSFAKPEGAFYLLCETPSRDGEKGMGDDIEFSGFLKEYKILVVPATGFGAPGWFRISYAVPEATIQGALPRFEKALADWRKK